MRLAPCGRTLAGMSDYELKNFAEVENLAANRGPGLDARFARKHLGSEHLGVSLFRFAPSFRTPFGHRHEMQEEAYVVVEGSGRVKLDDEIRELAQWDVLRVAPPVARAFEAGPEGLTLIAIGSDKPADGSSEAEMIQDFWN
jgi:quercetin dioxygenase-like cupin family protein